MDGLRELDDLSKMIAEYASILDISGQDPAAWSDMVATVREIRSNREKWDGEIPQTFSAMFKYVALANRTVVLCERMRALFVRHTPTAGSMTGSDAEVRRLTAKLHDLNKKRPPTLSYDRLLPREMTAGDVKVATEVFEKYDEKKRSSYVVDLYVALLGVALRNRDAVKSTMIQLDRLKRRTLEGALSTRSEGEKEEEKTGTDARHTTRRKQPNLPQFLIQRHGLVPCGEVRAQEQGRGHGRGVDADMTWFSYDDVSYDVEGLFAREATLKRGYGISEGFLDATRTITGGSATKKSSKTSCTFPSPGNHTIKIAETTDGENFRYLVPWETSGARTSLEVPAVWFDKIKDGPSVQLRGYNVCLEDAIVAQLRRIPERAEQKKTNVDRMVTELMPIAIGSKNAKLSGDDFLRSIVASLSMDVDGAPDTVTTEMRLSFLQDEVKLMRSLRSDMAKHATGLPEKGSHGRQEALRRVLTEVINGITNRRGMLIENVQKMVHIFSSK